MSYTVRPRSRNDLRNLAAYLRSTLGYSEDQPFDPVRFLEVLSQFDADYEIVETGSLGVKHGETLLKERLIRIPEDVYNRAVMGEGRDRFTICHEIAHVLLHRADDVRLARSDGESDIPPYMNPEWQADAFAAELLMPYRQLRTMKVHEIMDRYGVSYSAAASQLRRCWQ